MVPKDEEGIHHAAFFNVTAFLGIQPHDRMESGLACFWSARRAAAWFPQALCRRFPRETRVRSIH